MPIHLPGYCIFTHKLYESPSYEAGGDVRNFPYFRPGYNHCNNNYKPSNHLCRVGWGGDGKRPSYQVLHGDQDILVPRPSLISKWARKIYIICLEGIYKGNMGGRFISCQECRFLTSSETPNELLDILVDSRLKIPVKYNYLVFCTSQWTMYSWKMFSIPWRAEIHIVFLRPWTVPRNSCPFQNKKFLAFI